MIKYFKYNDEHNEWLKENWNKMSEKELAIQFNNKFNVNKKAGTLSKHCIKILKLNQRQNCRWHNYTQEQKEWLIQNRKNYSCAQLTEIFNKKFNCDVKPFTLNYYITKVLKITITDFQHLHTKKNEIKVHSDGQVYIKVDTLQGTKYRHSNWKLLQRYMWEKHYGAIPKNHCILFLDGDSTNCNIENLKCVSYKTINKLTHRGWYGKNELTLAGIKCCELEEVLKNV